MSEQNEHDQAMAEYTPRALQTLVLARKEADALSHLLIDTVHLLLGLIRLGRRIRSVSFACGLLLTFLAQLSIAGDARVVDVRKIWDAAPHNAFTDLLRWRGRWWCSFRESEAHVGGDGKIRVITSIDGARWDSAAVLSETNIDLRDTKLSVTPNDRLMIVAGGSVYLGTKQLKGFRPRVTFSKNGHDWSKPQPVLSEWEWLWRVTWHAGQAYGAAYRVRGSATNGAPLNLYRSGDGLAWERVSPMEVPGQANETTLRFNQAGELLAMVRRDAGNRKGWLGRSKPPYTKWNWHELNYQLGGPNFIETPAGFIAATRDYTTKPVTTLIARLDNDALQPLATLPSGGDNSYPGLVWDSGELWVSYYSSHEGKTSIYLARLDLDK